MIDWYIFVGAGNGFFDIIICNILPPATTTGEKSLQQTSLRRRSDDVESSFVLLDNIIVDSR